MAVSPRRGKGRAVSWLREHVSYSGDGCLMWPFARDNHGYAIMGFNGKGHKGYRFMCELIHGPAPSPKHHAAHSCGKGQEGCVHPGHVSWKAPKENMEDSVRLGTVRQPGERPRVTQILALKGKMSYGQIGAMFGVKGKQIGKIHRGEQWKGGKKSKLGFATLPWTRERREQYAK